MNVLALDTASPRPGVCLVARGEIFEEDLPGGPSRLGETALRDCPLLRAGRDGSDRMRPRRGLLRSRLVHGASSRTLDRVGPRPRPRDPGRGRTRLSRESRRRPARRIRRYRHRGAGRRTRRGRRRDFLPAGPAGPPASGPRRVSREEASAGAGVGSSACRKACWVRAAAPPAVRFPRRGPRRGGRSAGKRRGRRIAPRHLLPPERRGGETWRSVSRSLAPYLVIPARTEHLDEIARIERESFLVPWKREFFESELAEPYRYSRVLASQDGSIPASRRLPLRGVALRRVPHQQDRDRLRASATGASDACCSKTRSPARVPRAPRPSRSKSGSPTSPRGEFYASYGFREAYRRRSYYQDGEDAFAMILPLRP